jgi:elongation factor Ts
VSVVDPSCDAFLSFLVGGPVGVEGVSCRWVVCGGVGCWVEVCRWCRYGGEWLRLSGRDVALNHLPNTIEELKALPYDDKLSIEEKITEHVGVIGEKLDLSKYAKISAEQVSAYNHPGNQLATLVGLTVNSAAAEDAGKQVAMQIAAMNPLALNKEGIDQNTIDRELEIGKELAIQEGKPAEMAEKISQGRLNKFFQENTLLSQQFVRDNKVTVEEFLNSAEKGLTVTSFERFAMK